MPLSTGGRNSRPLFVPHYRCPEGNFAHACAVQEDGAGQRKLSPQQISGLHGISRDGRWVIAKTRGSGRDAFIAIAEKDGSTIPMLPAEVASWSADGKYVYVSSAAASVVGMQIGKTYAVPLPAGRMFPSGSVKTAAEIAKLPGVRTIDAFDAVPGPSPETYAFSRPSVQRNLFRIPIR